MSVNLDPGEFVILWMIQVGTWRETLWERSRPWTWYVVFGRRPQNGTWCGTLAPWSGWGQSAGYAALRTRVRLPGLRPAGPLGPVTAFSQAAGGGLSAPDLLSTGLHNRKPARVCFVLLRLLACWLADTQRVRGGGRAGAAGCSEHH